MQKIFMKNYRILSVILFFGFVTSICFAIGGNEEQLVEDVPTPGELSAIKRAYQMTDIIFSPVDCFKANPRKTYYSGVNYQGLPYSSVKEMHQFIGIDVSVYTFMTALHNPRSMMYSEDVSKPPYHGGNCAAYYGTVCSAFVSYALDINVYMKSYDYPHSDCFQLIDDQSSRGIRLADVINSGGHVQLVTRIKRNPKTGKAVEIELCEGVKSGCRRIVLTGKALDKKIARGKRKIYRYMYLDKVHYQPLTDFVALEGERIVPFKYNDDICTSKGDKACYIVGDSVILNIAKGYNTLELYKDSLLYRTIEIGHDTNILLTDLPYGDYKARVVKGKKKSDFTYWKMIDTQVNLDRNSKTVSFSSANATPVYLEFANIKGNRPIKGVFEFTDEDISKGCIDVSSYKISSMKRKTGMYVRVHFECDYGRVMNKPVRW